MLAYFISSQSLRIVSKIKVNKNLLKTIEQLSIVNSRTSIIRYNNKKQFFITNNFLVDSSRTFLFEIHAVRVFRLSDQVQ
jgi:hypothetical protein